MLNQQPGKRKESYPFLVARGLKKRAPLRPIRANTKTKGYSCVQCARYTANRGRVCVRCLREEVIQ